MTNQQQKRALRVHLRLSAILVQSVRREGGIYESVRLLLRNLDKDAHYQFEYVESGLTRVLSGKELT